VRGVDRHALGAVDGGGVAEIALGGQVVGGQADAAAVLGVADHHVPTGKDLGDGPGVAVLHKVAAAAHVMRRRLRRVTMMSPACAR